MKRKVSLLTLIVSCLLVSAISYSVPKYFFPERKTKIAEAGKKADCHVEMDQIRPDSYKYTRPLLLSNVSEQNPSFNSLRSKVEQYVSQARMDRKVDQISVYFRKMNDGSWFCLNPELTVNPASMSKIIFLITYLKDAETRPELLNKKIFFEKHFSEAYKQNIKDFELTPKKYYTIRELLTYMIKYSDNDATILLIQNINKPVYEKIFSDFKIPLPPEIGEYEINAQNFSKFFRALYNGTYIRPDLSDYGLKLLTTCSYSEGIIKGIETEIEVAHKFGERITDQGAQLHEFGIVYLGHEPYMLGVLTKGSNLKQLSEVISGISRITFNELRFKPLS